MALEELLPVLAVVCPLVFAAGFVDSVAGGGGLISLPAYLFAGLPIHLAYGSNKFSSACGTAVAAFRYLRGGCLEPWLALVSAGAALAGSWAGARLVLAASERTLRLCLLVILPAVALFLLFHRDFGREDRARPLPRRRAALLSAAIGLALGAYDGFFGPGTGTFLAIAFTGLLKLPLTTATGNTKAVNLASNLAALAVYLGAGSVLFPVAVPAALCNVAGSFLGSSLAIRRGAAFIRPVILLSVGLLFVNIAADLL